MSRTISTADWLAFLEREYLDDFVREGGAAVKFLAGPSNVGRVEIARELRMRAEARGYVVAELSAAGTRIHLIDRFLAQVCRQIPWHELAWATVCRLARANGWECPPTVTESGLVHEIATSNGLDDAVVRMTLERAISQQVFRDRELAKDFRVAMTWLCRAELAGADERDTITNDITAWLVGEANLSTMRQYTIFGRINRFTARHLLESLCNWIPGAGRTGLVVLLDIDRLSVRTRPADGSLYYTKASLLDAYEVLRQFIDETDSLRNVLFCVLAGDGFLDPEPGGRGMGAYQALMNRVFDEVHDRDRANPMGALVRVGEEVQQ